MSKKDHKLTFTQLVNLNALVGKVAASKIDITALRGLVVFQKAINDNIELHNSAQEKLTTEYDLVAKQGRINWSDHEKADEIEQKFNELAKQEYNLSKSISNFLDEEVFFKCVQNSMNISEITFVQEYLQK